MSKQNDYINSNSDFSRIIERFNEMARLNKQYFFDVHEFEGIIDYFLTNLNFHKALEAVYIALSQHPGSCSIRLKQARTLIESGKPDNGLQVLGSIGGLETYNQELYIIKGYAYAVKGNMDEACKNFDEALEVLFEDEVEIILEIVNLLQQLNYYQLAIRYLHRALEIDANNCDVFYELAHSYELVGVYTRSIKYYGLYLDQRPYSAHVWHNLGLVYSLNEEYGEAVDAFDFAIVIDDKYTTAYFNKACALRSLGKYHEAISEYKEFLKLEKNNAQAECFIAECYERLDDYRSALAYYDRAIINDKTSADGWFGYGFVLKLQEKPDLAIPYIEQALSLDSQNPEYLYVLGESYYECENLDMAEDCLKKVVELDPYDYEAWLLYSKLYFDKDEVQLAIDVLFRATENLKDCAPINFRLAAYYFTSNNYKLAKKFFRAGLSLCKNNDEVNEIIEYYSPIISDSQFQEFLK